MNNTTTLRLLRLADVRDRIPLSKAAIYQKIAAGEFPRPHKYGGSALWSEAEIDELIESIRTGVAWAAPTNAREEVAHESQ